MKILFTGVSSFTGFWFVKALAANGHDVVCPITKTFADYSGMRSRRLEKIQPLTRLVPNAPFGSQIVLNLLRENHYDLLCHHAADATNYKSPDFDALRALANNTTNLRE